MFLGFFLRRPMLPNTKVWPKSIWNLHLIGLIQCTWYALFLLMDYSIQKIKLLR